MRTKLIIILALLTVTMAEASDTPLKSHILVLSSSWEEEAERLTNYLGLSGFCFNKEYREGIHAMLEEIHYFHGLLYQQLKSKHNHHEDRTISRILLHIEQIEADYHLEAFNDFFRERCESQVKLEKHSDHYKSGFGVHSYDGKIYVLEEELRRYVKKLTKRIGQVRKHVHRLHLEEQDALK